MSDSPRVGLVMAAYNATAFLAEAIEGVVNQDFTDFACRIVDDGSTDGTADLARSLTVHDSRFAVDEVPHVGQSMARNIGVSRLPHTQYLSFPDSDDVWHPDALSSLVEAADKNAGVGAHALATMVDVEGKPFDDGGFVQFGRERVHLRKLRKQRVPLDMPSSFESLLCACTVYPPGVWIIRRDVFDEVGGFDPDLRLFEDWDLQIRASRLGEYAFLDHIVVDYRRHPAQISASPHTDSAIAELRDKTVRATVNSRIQRRTAAVVWRANEFRNAARSARLIAERRGESVGKEARTAARCLARSLAGPRLTRPRHGGGVSI